MNWKFTHIEHPARIALGLNISEYCVLDIIYQSQVHPSFTKGGWTDAGCHRIAKFLGMAPSGVKQMLDRLVEFGMVEYADETKYLKRTTKKWYDYAYLKEEGVQNVIGGVQNVRVQKVNTKCSESEHPPVQKVNTKCSESEHKYNIPKVVSNLSEGARAPETAFDFKNQLKKLNLFEDTVENRKTLWTAYEKILTADFFKADLESVSVGLPKLNDVNAAMQDWVIKGDFYPINTYQLNKARGWIKNAAEREREKPKSNGKPNQKIQSPDPNSDYYKNAPTLGYARDQK